MIQKFLKLTQVSSFVIVILLASFICQAFGSVASAAFNQPQSPVYTANISNPLTPQRITTLPNDVEKLLGTNSATYALVRVAPDQKLRLFSSKDGGVTWNYKENRTAKPVPGSDAPNSVSDFEAAPNNPQLLFVLTDYLYYTADGGQTWNAFGNNLPGGTAFSHFIAVTQGNSSSFGLWVAGGNQLWQYKISSSDGKILQTESHTLCQPI